MNFYMELTVNTPAVMPNYGFDELVRNESVEFKVTPPPIGRSEVVRGLAFKLFLSFWGLIFGFIIAIFFKSDWALLFPLTGAVGTWMLLGRTMNNARNVILKTANIKVSSEGIAVDGKSFAREHISDFWVERGQGEFVVANQGGAGVARYSDEVMKRMFSVQMRYGAEHIILANGVTEGTANALMEKVLSAYKKYVI